MQAKISPKEAGQRLDIWLAVRFHDKSRHWLKKEIQAGRVLINEKEAKPSKKLKENDTVEVNLKEPLPFKLEADQKIKIKTVYEDENFVVIDKQPGISVHPAAPPRNDTLVNGLLAEYPEIKNVGDRPEIRPGIVHRLDKDTSGLMVVARNQKAFDLLKGQFQKRQVEKKYLALVSGHPKKNSGVIENFIGRSLSSPTKQTVVGKKASFKQNFLKRIAKTAFEVKKRLGGYTLIECRPKTGRMHQIRVHLKFVGLPIVGDQKYGLKKEKLGKKLKRQFLHAQSLSFYDLENHKISLESPLPKDLRKILKILEK